MLGYMMDTPLLTTDLLRHGLRNSPDQQIVSRLVEGGIHSYSFREAGARIAQLAHALKAMGIEEGDRVGVMAWNTYRQLELYYAVAGIGAVCHTINPRLGPENAAYVMNHAGDKVVFYDETFKPLAEGLAPHLPKVERYIAMSPGNEEVPADFAGKPVSVQDDLMKGLPEEYDWPSFDENTSCGMCYTSGTTGKPKGVVYTHRSQVLHALVTSLPSVVGFAPDEPVMAVVPMFHVNAWGLPFSALLGGTKLVLPGPGLDAPRLYDMIEETGTAYSLGVPTLWLNLLKHVEDNGFKFSTLKYVLSGGSALSERIIRGFERLGVRVRQGWGMTEMSPVGTTNFEEEGFFDLPEDERIKKQLQQGKPVPLVDMRIVSPTGEVLPHDGETDGHLQVRGPWVLSEYYLHDEPTLTADGWFDTGDVAVIHKDGRMQITDRAKDAIKSGGEWLSTIEIENAALSHPDVENAAVIGMPHPKWQERPLLIVQMDIHAKATPEDVLQFTRDRLPKISWPDDIKVVKNIPLGATGKVLKTELRKTFADYKLPTAS
ncbi:long-chain fatty acid--CoA ligase [Parvularcula marina]|uniref:Long-chain-fatty-acid--CoA ligase n=1 Tax=Parvularcula marina TaxID=2292771 RepID=A0A371RLF5_9PROT|nr:long-chain fatty acid--CoA ligase [Parvularcula marina]RFB06295.1 long-chain-fatty-acid--CoA ligase [Parvularcula marina]